ncbi:MAG: MFS transporter [Armatimonadota bacterium]
MDAAANPRVSLASPLAIRNFRNLWIGQSISLVGDQFKFVALSWLVLSLTGRSSALGTVLMLQAIPRAILMLVGGVASDRLRPRTVMLASDVLRAIVVGAIAVLTATGGITMPHVYALALLFGVVHAFFYPAASAMTPELIPSELLRPANAVNQMTNQIVLAGAPALAGFVIAAVGTAGGFAVDSASFLISAAFLFLITTARRDTAPGRSSAWREFLEGVAYVRQRRLLFTLIVTASVFFFGYSGTTYVGLPVLAKGPLDAGARGLGLLFSASGLGALAGGLLGGTMHSRRRGVIGMLLILMMGGLMAAISVTRSLWQVAVLLFLSGAAFAWIGITYVTVIQQLAERPFMGRVMGILLFGIYGLYPISYAVAGWMADVIGVHSLFALGGAMIVASALVGLSVPEMRALD